jgi:hypothetical protein
VLKAETAELKKLLPTASVGDEELEVKLMFRGRNGIHSVFFVLSTRFLTSREIFEISSHSQPQLEHYDTGREQSKQLATNPIHPMRLT